MATEFLPFAAEHLSAIRKFSERTWERPTIDAFYRWRYLECPRQSGLLALRDGECVATVWIMKRCYRLGGARVDMSETFDWYVLPELLNSGLGIRAMRRFMQRPEPILTVGGTDLTLRFLPRLGWRKVCSSCSYLFPLDGGALSGALETQVRLPQMALHAIGDLVTRTWCRPRQWSAPGRGDVAEVDSLGKEILSLYEGKVGYGCVPLPDVGWHAWLTGGGEGAGRFLTVHYRLSGVLVGWALGRIYATVGGREATIVDVFTPQPDVRLYSWMVSTLVERLAAFRPRCIRARATCPVLGSALSKNRFLRGPPMPVLLWSAERRELPAPVHLMGNTADAPFFPYDIGSTAL